MAREFDEMADFEVRVRGTGWRLSLLITRLFSLVALCAVVYALAHAARAGYYAMSDSFVAPIILSPDSELVLPSKLNLARLQAERQALLVRIEENRSALHAADEGIVKLTELQATLSRALEWSDVITEKATSSDAHDLRAVRQQRGLLEQSIAKQSAFVEEMRRNLEAGLVHRADLVREENELGRLRVLALDNDRDRVASQTRLHESALARSALRRQREQSLLATPEMTQHRDQLVRLELDLLKLQAEKRTRTMELGSAEHELVRIDELIAQMKQRPVFRAIESRQNVAFVPYTQIDGVTLGAPIYECELWGVFFCERVGRVTEVVPGEVAMQDPWGSPSRGQYALLELYAPAAARSKVLRVRQPSDPAPSLLSSLLARFL